MDIVGAIIHIIAILMFLASGMLMEIVRYFHKHLDDSDSDTPAFYRAIGVVGTILLILCGYSLKWKWGQIHIQIIQVLQWNPVCG